MNLDSWTIQIWNRKLEFQHWKLDTDVTWNLEHPTSNETFWRNENSSTIITCQQIIDRPAWSRLVNYNLVLFQAESS